MMKRIKKIMNELLLSNLIYMAREADWTFNRSMYWDYASNVYEKTIK